MLSSFSAKSVVFALVAVLGLGSIAQADSVIRVLNTPKLKVLIKTSAVPANGHFAAGAKGLLEIQHSSHSYAWKQIDKQDDKIDVPLDNVTVAPSTDPPSGGDTFFTVTGGYYTLTKDTNLKIKGSGVNLLIPQNTQISLATLDKIVMNMGPNGPKSSTTPVSGTQVTVATAEISKAGVKAGGTLQMVNADLPGVSVGNATFNWKLDATNELDPDSVFSLDQIGTADFDVSVDIPGINGGQSNPCTLKVHGFKLNADNDPTFDGTVVAPAAGIRIPLANPANFALIIYSGGHLKMEDGSVEEASISGALELPPEYSIDGTNPALIKFTLQKDDTVGLNDLLASTNPVAAKSKLKLVISKQLPALTTKFGEFKLELKAGDYAIDLDKNASVDPSFLSGAPTSPALKPAWMGLVIKQATLYFPKELGDNSSVIVNNVLIGPGGLNGTFSANNFKVPYFTNSKLDTLSGTFLQGKLTNFTGKGTIHVEDLKTDIGVKISATGSGAFTLAATQGQAVKVGAFDDQVSLAVDHGTFTYDKQKKTANLSIAGSLTFDDSVPSIGGTTLGFQNLSISSSGKSSVAGGYVDLPNPVKVPLGPAAVTLEQFGIITHTEGAYSTPAIKLTGSVSVADDLPVNGSIGFDGLTIYKNAANKVKLDWGEIDLDLDIDKVGSLKADLEKGDFPDDKYTAYLAAHPTVASPWRNRGSVTWLTGSGTLSLDCLKAGPVAIDFISAPKAWYVSATVPLPAAGIEIGTSGLGLFGFTGGLGRNITSYSGDSGMLGVPQVDYVLIPLPPDIQPGTPNWDKKWLFKAGATIGTMDKFTVWGDAVLTASIGSSSFFIDLDGKFYIMQAMGPAARANPDRFAHVNLHYDSPTDTFTAKANADLYFPDRAHSVLHATAPLDLLLSPSVKHFYIGGNVVQNPGNKPTMTDPASITVGPFTGNGVMMVDFPNASHEYMFKAGGIVGASLSFDADLDWVKLEGGLSADAYFYCDASLLAATATTPLRFNGANGQIGLDASLWGDAKIGRFKWGFSASGHADLTAYLSPSYDLSGDGTLSGNVAFGRFHKGFSTGFHF